MKAVDGRCLSLIQRVHCATEKFRLQFYLQNCTLASAEKEIEPASDIAGQQPNNLNIQYSGDMKKQDSNEYREAQRIELHAQNKIFESIPNRKLLKARIDGPYMLQIQFTELNHHHPENKNKSITPIAITKEMVYCGSFSVWWKTP